MVMAGTGLQTTTSMTTDILGAHLGYGRGCVMCHAPHSGSAGNGIAKGDATSGNIALWGQDLTPLYGVTLGFGDAGKYSVTLPGGSNTAQPTITSAGDANTVILFCLSCHDGNLAKVGMMQGHTVETLPIVTLFGSTTTNLTAPTLLGNDGSTAGNYNNDHPVGGTATVGCTGQYNWDCTAATSTTGPLLNGTNSSHFMTNYGFPVGGSFGTFGTGGVKNAVTCTTCHDQHSELIYSGTIGGVQGFYQTSFFIRGPYQPQTGGNNAAQFCRQCHGGESNEAHGQYNVPTN